MLTAPEIRTHQGDFDPRAFINRTGPGRATEKYEKNRKIFSQGDVADTVFFIQSGKVKVTVLSEHGKEAVVGIFAEGQFFGEAGLEGAAIRTTTGHAMEDCLITSITKQAMLAALASEELELPDEITIALDDVSAPALGYPEAGWAQRR